MPPLTTILCSNIFTDPFDWKGTTPRGSARKAHTISCGTPWGASVGGASSGGKGRRGCIGWGFITADAVEGRATWGGCAECTPCGENVNAEGGYAAEAKSGGTKQERLLGFVRSSGVYVNGETLSDGMPAHKLFYVQLIYR